MRRPLLVLAAPFAAGCLLVDGRGSVHEAVALAVLAAALLGLAAWTTTRRSAVAALAGAALALGSAAVSVEGLRIEEGALRSGLRSGALDGRDWLQLFSSRLEVGVTPVGRPWVWYR